ncbi:MAG: hypothetical protein ACM3ZV_08675 [Bacillota bacterium]
MTLPARAATSDTVTPEMFGAKGDGRTNDTRAFAALSAHVNARGGGTVVLRPVTYIVGEQSATGPYAFSPADILHFDGCRGPVVVRGNGATLRCAPGLRYGGFDRSGRALPDARANMQLQNRAVPYTGMIFAENCTGLVDISDVTLDGNLGALQVGGRYDRRGWQAGASGIRMIRNKGPERISRVRSHHHAQDGLLLTAAMDRTGSTTVTDTVCDFNARQGCTISSGSNFVFERCSFRQTGLAPPLYRSLPGAGVDVEAEKASVRNVAFSACDFTDNAGIGLDAVSDVADMTFDSCKFIGSKNWSAWPAKPGMRFNNCLFLGTLRYLYGDPDPSRAPQFHGCTFTDDPALSPTGKVFLGQGRGTWIALAQKAQNARFTQCHFRLVGEGLLPLSDASVIYEDCDMSQRSPAPSAPRGTYLGTNRISGNVRLEGSIIRGTVLLNGRPVVG